MLRHWTSVLVALSLAAMTGACGSTGSSPSPSGGSGGALATPSLGHRPHSTATISIISPTNGEVIHGTTVHIVIGLKGGQVTPAIRTTDLPSNLGHVHLYLDGQLTYMDYKLTANLPVTPGSTYSLHAEFVAEDHFPFSPRVVTPTIYFTVAPS